MRLFPDQRSVPIVKPRLRAGLWARVRAVILLVVFAVVIPSDGYLGEAREDFVVRKAIAGEGFRFVAWEGQAIRQKVRDAIAQPGAELAPEAQRALVTGYLARVQRIDEINREIERAYAELGDAADTGVAPLEAELSGLRAERAAERPAVERIIEQQVAAVLSAEGLDTAGHVFPPVRFQFTESPNLLILSPKSRISFDRSVHLNPAMPVEQMSRIETEMEETLADRSALIEGTGGFSSYPTMVLEYSVLEWVLDTVAHEWVHTYLALRPLGWAYFEGGAMRTINETVASIVGEEVSRRATASFYPDRVGAATWPRPLSMRGDWLREGDAEARTDFNYGAFMRRTRLETDRLLAEGKIAEAETYMEMRRQELLDQGYVIRKLNQAYFAFHGSYAVGAFATDPIGAKLRALRARSPSLLAFMVTAARINDPADLDAALGLP
jgi:hypothetical protein